MKILLTIALTALLQQTPPGSAPPAGADWRTAGSSRLGDISFGEGPEGAPAAGEEPPAEPCLLPSSSESTSQAQARRVLGCTAEERAAAIQRACGSEGEAGTDAFRSCARGRRASLLSMLAIARPETGEPRTQATATTTWEAANHACRGQTWRQPSETVRACTERLVSTDALSQPLPQGRAPTEPRCRREGAQREDGTGFSVSVSCTEITVSPPSPR